MKASRQNMPPSLPALLLSQVLVSLQLLPHHGDGSPRREPGGRWETDGPSPDLGDSGYGDMVLVWSPRSAPFFTARLQGDPAASLKQAPWLPRCSGDQRLRVPLRWGPQWDTQIAQAGHLATAKIHS